MDGLFLCQGNGGKLLLNVPFIPSRFGEVHDRQVLSAMLAGGTRCAGNLVVICLVLAVGMSKKKTLPCAGFNGFPFRQIEFIILQTKLLPQLCNLPHGKVRQELKNVSEYLV